MLSSRCPMPENDGCPLQEWLVVMCMVALVSSSSCPTVCICGWKNGRYVAECQNKGLDNVPYGLDPQTQVLDLTKNNLQTLPKHAFRREGLINLQKIYLRDCKIGHIDPTAFSHLTNLLELDLSENLLTDVPAVALSYTNKLRDLSLGGNKLHKIRFESFSHTPSLVHLNLSHARIRTIALLAFRPLSLLESIDLQGNQLSELSAAAVKSLERVHRLKVHDNPWVCDCRVLPLWRLLEKRRIPHPVSPSCHSPKRIAGYTFQMLTDEDFACPPSILPVEHEVEGVVGENTSVACPVQGQPPPRVMWYKDEMPVVNGSVVGLGPQQIYIINEASRTRVSRLVITGAQETDSGTLRCVAINSAGMASANFTLSIKMAIATHARLDSSHIAGISMGLVVAALMALVVGFLVLAHSHSNAPPTTV